MTFVPQDASPSPAFLLGDRLPTQAPSIVDRPSAECVRNRRQFAQLSHILGTGGAVSHTLSYNMVFTSGDLVIVIKNTGVPVPQMIREIRDYLIPQIKDLATVFKVKRPSVYAWLNGGNISASHLARISEIHHLTGLARSKFAGIDRKRVEAALIATSLVDVLDQDTITSARVSARLDNVLAAIQQKNKQLETRKQVDLLATARRVGAPNRESPDSQLQSQILAGKGYVFEADE